MARWTARFLAPVALAAVAVGAYLIVHANTTSSMTSGHKASTVLHAKHGGHTKHPAKAKTKSAFYTVKSGDTLSDISSKTGVSIEKLATLNPTLKPPYALQTGQRLRLRR
jgi:LysM repeat protein